MNVVVDAHGGWVEESAFGVWFLNTKTWTNHVLKVALTDLERLMQPRQSRYPVILDVGFGHGHSLLQLDERFRPDTILALDVDPRASQWSAARVARCQAEVEILIGNAAKIPLPDRSSDLVFCHQTFHHIVDQTSAAAEFFRILKPGGVLLFAESCRRYIHSWLIRLLFSHPMDVQKTDIEYTRLLRDAGFLIRPETISTPYLWWSRADLGLLEALGAKIPAQREETLLNLAAYRPE